MPKTPYQTALAKVQAGKELFLNFMEVRAVDQRHHKSFEREIEFCVDDAVSYNVGLSGQFFVDARGPDRGYSGALACLKNYVGEDCAPGLTHGQVERLRVKWADIANSIKSQIMNQPLKEAV